jgi:hypothetical protein
VNRCACLGHLQLLGGVFVVGGPLFGWLIDRYGQIFDIAWCSAANINSFFVYIAFPNFIGLATRSFDDSPKALSARLGLRP